MDKTNWDSFYICSCDCFVKIEENLRYDHTYSKILYGINIWISHYIRYCLYCWIQSITILIQLDCIWNI